MDNRTVISQLVVVLGEGKENDMKKKTVNNIFKGIVGVGLTLGGVSVLSDANIVYAEELDQQLQEQLEQPTVEELEQQASASVTEMQSVSEASSESGAESVAAVTEQSTSDSTEASESTSEAGLNSVAGSESAAASQEIVDSTSEVTSDSISATESQLTESLSTATSEYESSSTVASEAVEEYEDALKIFKENKYDDPYLEKLLKDISAAQKTVSEAEAGKSTVDGNYYRAADQLANLLIQYKFYQEGFVGDIECSKWVSNTSSSGYVQNYVKVTYNTKEKDESGNYIKDEAYFDYVTADRADEWLFGQKGKENNTQYIDHILIVKKTPIYESDDGSRFMNAETVEGTSVYYEGTKDTIEKDEQRIAVSQGEQEITEDGVTKIVKTEVTGNNREGFTVKKTVSVKDSGEELTVTTKTYKKLNKFLNKGDNYFSEKDFNEGKDDYQQKRTSLTEAEKKKNSASEAAVKISNSIVSKSTENANSLVSAKNEAINSYASATSESQRVYESASDSAAIVSKQSVANSTLASESSSLAASTSESNSTSAYDSYNEANAALNSLYAKIDQLKNPAQPGTSYPASVTAPVAPTTTTEITDEEVPFADAEIEEERETEKEAEKDTSKSTDATKTNEAVTTLEDEDVPLSDGIDDAAGTEIADEDVPLAVIDLDESTELLDEDVPLSDNPETGDAMTMTWLGTAAAAVTGLFGASKGKKKKNADQK